MIFRVQAARLAAPQPMPQEGDSMTEAAPEQPTPDAPAEPQEGGATEEPKTFDADYVAGLRKEAAKYRSEARQAAAELEKQRKASMTEAERAVAEAEQRGRTSALGEFGKRLARAEFDSLAGRRNPDFDTASALEYVDLGRFVGEDGEPDTKAIKAAVQQLIPEPVNGAPSFDGGARTTAPAPRGMSDLIRAAAGRA